MSEVRSDIDLSALARPGASLEPPPSRWRRYLIPVLVLVGFAAVLATTLSDLLKPVTDVSVERPRAPRAGERAQASAGTVVLQAAGWVEPDPFLVHVPALAEGVVRELLVEESDVVEAGAPVARMIEDDARIAHSAAVATLALRRAELAEAEARHGIANERLEAALEVTEAVALARADLAGKIAAAEERKAAALQGESRVALAEDELVVQRELEAAGASGARQVEIAANGVAEAVARRAELDALAARALADVEAAEARKVRAESDVKLRFVDRLEVEMASARVDHARAEVRGADTKLEEAALRLERMTIRSPVSGVVLERLTVPGMVLSVATMGHAVCSIYDPTALRVRVDVPQGDVGEVFTGQRAHVLAESREGKPYQGEVIRVVQQADIQKVTLQVHVRILDGDALLRPEMLTQVRFFGSGEAVESDSASELVLISKRLIQDGSVWVVDGESGVARQRSVQTGADRGDLVEVLSGLNLTDKIIDEGRTGLAEGARVRVIN